MSLSKPEILGYTVASAVIGIILAALLKRESIEQKHALRDTEEKIVGKSIPLVRKNTMIIHDKPELHRSKSSISMDDIERIACLNANEATELKKLIRRQQE